MVCCRYRDVTMGSSICMVDGGGLFGCGFGGRDAKDRIRSGGGRREKEGVGMNVVEIGGEGVREGFGKGGCRCQSALGTVEEEGGSEPRGGGGGQREGSYSGAVVGGISLPQGTFCGARQIKEGTLALRLRYPSYCGAFVMQLGENI